jgi:hypothetical protein
LLLFFNSFQCVDCFVFFLGEKGVLFVVIFIFI